MRSQESGFPRRGRIWKGMYEVLLIFLGLGTDQTGVSHAHFQYVTWQWTLEKKSVLFRLQ